MTSEVKHIFHDCQVCFDYILIRLSFSYEYEFLNSSLCIRDINVLSYLLKFFPSLLFIFDFDGLLFAIFGVILSVLVVLILLGNIFYSGVLLEYSPMQ